MIYGSLLRLSSEGSSISEVEIEDTVVRFWPPSMMIGASNKAHNYISHIRFCSNTTPDASQPTLGIFSYRESERTRLPPFLHAQANVAHVEILRTNRLIHQETAPILYIQHMRFNCAAERTLVFIKDAPQSALKYITSIQFFHVDGTDLMQLSKLCRFVQTRL